MSKTYAPLFPVSNARMSADCIESYFEEQDAWRSAIAHTPTPASRDESNLIRSTADRWRFTLLWQDEPHDQFEGIEPCACLLHAEGGRR